MSEHNDHFIHNLDKSAIFTFIGIVLLFSCAVVVTLFAPSMVDPSWTEPTSPYMVQIYEVVDPNVYISSGSTGSMNTQVIYHLKNGFSLLSFKESEGIRIIAPPPLEKFITRQDDKVLKLTSSLMLLRKPQANEENGYNPVEIAANMRADFQKQWQQSNPKEPIPAFTVLELYAPKENEAFAAGIATEGILENWVDKDYTILDDTSKYAWHNNRGVVFVSNPQEYRIQKYKFAQSEGWRYDPQGEKLKNLEELNNHPLGFLSRKKLIEIGETIYAHEGCWYCHTDQTRTLIQDVVLNGSDSFPAPPSSANEYIYQRVTFPGTRRIGPDLSRVGVKRPSRDWHKAHFWAPKTASKGSIMPSFRQFFDDDPRGTGKNPYDLPNYKFEAVYQYLMTKGTRITPPTEAWWLGKDPINTIEIIENRKKLAP